MDFTLLASEAYVDGVIYLALLATLHNVESAVLVSIVHVCQNHRL